MNAPDSVVVEDTASEVLGLRWVVVGLLMILGGVAVASLAAATLPANGSVRFWLGYAAGYTVEMALLPAIAALWTRFRRPGFVLAVWVPIAVIFLVGAIKSLNIHEARSRGQESSQVADHMIQTTAGSMPSVSRSVRLPVTQTPASVPKWNDLVPITPTPAKVPKWDDMAPVDQSARPSEFAPRARNENSIAPANREDSGS